MGRKSPSKVSGTKKIRMQVDIDTAMSIESDVVGRCSATEDKIEGMTAFVEKRKAGFKGK